MTQKKRSVKKSPASIDVIVATQTWTRAVRSAPAVCRRAALAALDACSLRKNVEVSILLTTDAAVRKLNKTFRGKDKSTNVLSFPSASDDAGGFPPGDEPVMLGDIAAAYGVSAREAKAEEKALGAHLSHLVVHGVLHLLGYDHEKESEAATMERWERKILARLGISDPYAGTILEVPKSVPRKKRSAR